MPDTDFIKSLFDRVFASAPPLYLFFSLIALGYALKLIQTFPNPRIPLVLLVVSVIAFPLMNLGKDHGAMPPNWLPVVGTVIRDVLGGVIIHVVAWLFHNQVMKRFVDKFMPTNSEGDTKFFPNPAFPPDTKTKPPPT